MSNSAAWQSYGGSTVDRYLRYLVPAIFLPWAGDLVARAALQPGERVLDVACGPGVVALLAAERVGATGRVVGLDINAEMLQAARALPSSGSVAWSVGDAVALPFGDHSFDVVLCQQGLQFVPDRPRALGEMQRVLDRGGRLLLSVWAALEQIPGWQVLRAARTRHDTPQSVVLLDVAMSLHDPDELRHRVAGAGFDDVQVQTIAKTTHLPSAEALALGTAGSTLVETDPVAWQALVAECTEALRPYGDEAGLRFPATAHVVMARRTARPQP